MKKTPDKEERAIYKAFKTRMDKENAIRTEANLPIAKYDVFKEKAYLLYPNGKKVWF